MQLVSEVEETMEQMVQLCLYHPLLAKPLFVGSKFADNCVNSSNTGL